MEEKLSERDVLSIDTEKYIENHNILFQAGYSRLAAKLLSKCATLIN